MARCRHVTGFRSPSNPLICTAFHFQLLRSVVFPAAVSCAADHRESASSPFGLISDESAVSAITLAELSVRPNVANDDAERPRVSSRGRGASRVGPQAGCARLRRSHSGRCNRTWNAAAHVQPRRLHGNPATGTTTSHAPTSPIGKHCPFPVSLVVRRRELPA